MGSPAKKTVIILAGPTAVGKTAAAIQLALHFQTEIISADSRQCYRELRIGVARPSDAELNLVPHYFIASHSIHQEVTAVTFEQYALEQLERLFREQDVVIMTGGTGLYIKAFAEGLHPVPAIDPELRQQIIAAYKEKGIGWLQQQLALYDPEFSQKGEMQNPQRMMRALEVVTATGQSILGYRAGATAQRDFAVIKMALTLPREELNRNIVIRTEQMFREGLVAEVRDLLPYRGLHALQSVGYREIFDYLDGVISEEAAKEQIIINTRQYAKRQMTWFKKDTEWEWFAPGQAAALVRSAEKQLAGYR